jgi:protein tyrosine phosphatase (PTP) superfamily phosphohydrolase (DUF442 family)
LKLLLEQVYELASTCICMFCNSGKRCCELYVQLQRLCCSSDSARRVRL